jgi:hypothetical protein
MPIVVPTFIGKTLIVVGAAVHGYPRDEEPSGSTQKRFMIRNPAVDIVLRKMIEGATHETQSMRPYQEEVEAWLQQREITILASSE